MRWNKLPRPDFEKSVNVPMYSLSAAKAEELNAAPMEGSIRDVDRLKLAAAVMNGSNKLNLSEIRALPYLLLDPELAHLNPEFSRNVIENFSIGKAFWRKLFNSWLFYYPLNSEHGLLVRDSLIRNQSLLNSKQLNLVSELRVLDELDLKLVLKVLASSESLLTMKEIGLVEGRPSTRIATAVLECLAVHCSSGRASAAENEIFLNLVVCKDVIHDSAKACGLVGLVVPLKDFSPDDRAVKRVRKIIQNSLPDPRIDDRLWPAISNKIGGDTTRRECLKIVKKWNVFQSITLFFRIIEDVVEREDAKHHFPKRKEFWLRYFKQKAVSEAWVVLGRKAESRIKELKKRGDEEIQGLSFGVLNGASYDQCVLIMRVGDLTVMEWSHSGACRVWNRSDTRAPFLNRTRYEREQLMQESSHRIVHDARGGWTVKLHDILRKQGGIRSVV